MSDEGHDSGRDMARLHDATAAWAETQRARLATLGDNQLHQLVAELASDAAARRVEAVAADVRVAMVREEMALREAALSDRDGAG